MLIVLFFTFVANAQTYQISFEGTGGSTTVSSVKVDNLTSGTSVTLNGNQQLLLTGTTGVDLIEKKQESQLIVYSNPETGKALVRFYPPDAGNAIINVFDIYGKCIAKQQLFVDNNPQEFMISGIPQGTYLLSILGATYNYTGKLLCNVKSTAAICFEKLNDTNIPVFQKMSGFTSTEAADIVEMAYKTGDVLKYTCTSGNYKTIISDIPTENKTISIEFVSCTDGDNNNYPVVRIGTQLWMAENLRTTHFANGSTIYGQYDYNNTASNTLIYGKLYTWSAIMGSSASSNTSPSGVTGICPSGWHIPSLNELTTLVNVLGGSAVAGGKLKDAGSSLWSSPNTDATNSSGFSGVPGGFRGASSNYGTLGSIGYYWSATEYFANNAYIMNLAYNTKTATLVGNNMFKTFGFSCRCVKD